jgi:RNA ligase (TIGR02306 family)
LDGWQVVVDRKYGFKIDEPVLYFELDSVLPVRDPRFKKCGKIIRYEGQDGRRLTSTMVKTHISQGAIFHLKLFPEIEAALSNPDNGVGGRDFSEILGVKKWEHTGDRAEDHHGMFPVFIQKTDMVRVQNCPNLFIKDKYETLIYQESVKMDGASMTCYFICKDSPFYKSLPELSPDCASQAQVVLFDQGRFGVCSRNNDLKPSAASIYWQAAIHYGLPRKLAALGLNIAVQGELVGSSLQQNQHGYAEGEHEFFVFSVFDIDSQQRWDPADVERLAETSQLEHVPVLGYHTIRSIARNHNDLLCRANLHPDEGLVFKCINDGRWFKVISNHYLLNHEQ